jgi:pyruvate/2-oxoglutarate dehydrogenase complex dihydrolipoamide dehydrogenase (E3) component
MMLDMQAALGLAFEMWLWFKKIKARKDEISKSFRNGSKGIEETNHLFFGEARFTGQTVVVQNAGEKTLQRQSWFCGCRCFCIPNIAGLGGRF